MSIPTGQPASGIAAAIPGTLLAFRPPPVMSKQRILKTCQQRAISISQVMLPACLFLMEHRERQPGDPRSSFHTRGSNFDPISTTTKPTSETSVSSTENDFRVSCSVIPLSRETTQNPLSFIHETAKAAKPMLRKI